MVNDVEDDDSCPKPVGRSSVFYYGVGHMLNDITAACWFTYLLLFLTEIGLSPRDAAIVMLAGQIADGFATVFAGELIDRFGHFKIWHGAGSILAAISFSSVFGGCLPCKILSSSSPIIETISYSTSAAIFNVGWAATQVSHMSMVNCISLNSTSRVVMTSCRNAFTMVANLSLYAVALVVFSTTKATTHSDIENQYHWIAYTSIFIGCCFVGIFHLGTKEPRLKIRVHGTSYARISWAYWFKKVLYYQVGLVYMLTRLAQNVSQAYLAFYVIEDMRMAKSAKALVPAIIYISSFIVSIIMQEMYWTGQRLKAYYCAGGVLWVFCGASILFLPRSLSAFMYVISVFIGVANTLMTIDQIHTVEAPVWECGINRGNRSKHAKCSSWFRSKWLCICLWIFEFPRQGFVWTCCLCASVFSKLLTKITRNPFYRIYFSHKIWLGSASSCLFTYWDGYYIHYETPDTSFKILDGTVVGMIYKSIQFCIDTFYF